MSPEEIVALRKLLGLTQADFARLFDAHVMTVSKWERGVTSPSPYQVALMERFRQTAVAADARAREEIKQLMVSAGVIAVLVLLLTKVQK